MRSWHWIKTKIVHFQRRLIKTCNKFENSALYAPRGARLQTWWRPSTVSVITVVSKDTRNPIVPPKADFAAKGLNMDELNEHKKQ